MFLAEFLASKGLVLNDVIETVAARVGFECGDELYVSGSLVEGLGNSTSDIDLYLITDREVDLPRSGPAIVFDCGEATIDLECLRSAEIERLVELLPCDVRVDGSDHRFALAFSAGEMEKLSRLPNFKLLWGRPKPGRRTVERSSVGKLLFSRCLAIMDAVQIDFVGAWRDGDHALALLLANKLLGHAFDAVTAASGHLNGSEKWRLARLRSFSKQSSAVGIVSRSLEDLFLELIAFGAHCDYDRISHCDRILRVCNWVVPQAQRFFATDRVFEYVRDLDSLYSASTGNHGSKEPSQGNLMIWPGTQVRWINGELVVGGVANPNTIAIGNSAHRLLTRVDGQLTLNALSEWLARDRAAAQSAALSACKDFCYVMKCYGYLDEIQATSSGNQETWG